MVSLCAYVVKTWQAIRPNSGKLLWRDLAVSVFVQELEDSIRNIISLLLMFNLILS
jgi:hypothetical protein